MAGSVRKWTFDETMTLIQIRSENAQLFTGRRHTAQKAWEEILQMMGLTGVAPGQLSKKWDNLKRKYKELRCPATGTGTDRGEATAASWPFFTAMHEAIGGRPSIDPPILLDSTCEVAVASGSGSASTEAVQSQDTVADEATESGSDNNVEDAEPSTSAGPPLPKRRRTVLQFLEEEAAKEEDRFERQHQAMQDSSKRFLDLFEKLVNKD